MQALSVLSTKMFVNVLSLLVLASAQGTSISSLDFNDECIGAEQSDSSCGLSALQLRAAGSGVHKTHKTKLLKALAVGNRSGVVDAVLDHYFMTVNGPGSFLDMNVKPDMTWENCTTLNYTDWDIYQKQQFAKWKQTHPNESLAGHFHVFENIGHYQLAHHAPADEFYLFAMCGSSGWTKHEPSCRAAIAAVWSTRLLHQLLPAGPKFANLSVVSWGKYPSWVEGAVKDLNYSATPPSARLVVPNGILAYFNCDMARTLLTQSPNQMSRGTCSFTAALAALTKRAPAYAVKMSLRMFWTGQLSKSSHEACDYVYQQQPGLVPFKEDGSVFPEGYTGPTTAPCNGDPSTCSLAQGPYQAPGLQFMWTQSLISAWIRHSWGGCDEEGEPKAYLNYPGLSKKLFQISSAVQGGGFSSMLWVCNRVLDPIGNTCKALVNLGICMISDEDCLQLLTFPIEDTLANMWYMSPNQSESNRLERKYPVLAQYGQFLTEVSRKYPGMDSSKWAAAEGLALPSFTPDLLEEACEENIALLTVSADPLAFAIQFPEQWSKLRKERMPYYGTEGRPPSGSCDHVVFLQLCDEDRDEYTIWSWGREILVGHEQLLGVPVETGTVAKQNGIYNTGIVCGAITAHQVTKP
eukprot:TRINITY_DN10463_c0_g2_i1.p1 TRINITY_DN10463_c0_g2~~TRINITY_DN10463_c0_g2_i1.p1  ORF type:complete len:635 (+),score=82.28 TRINITY_DN10463_c0_g2_i1:36-1940(+)